MEKLYTIKIHIGNFPVQEYNHLGWDKINEMKAFADFYVAITKDDSVYCEIIEEK